MNNCILPGLGQLFRSVITSAGYRPRLVELGLDKDLDDLALGSRPSSSADLLLTLEEAIQRELAIDSGARWAQLLRWAWGRTREAVQLLACEVDSTAIDPQVGEDAIRSGFAVPMLSGLMRLAIHLSPGIDLDVWWRSPLASWVAMAADAGKRSADEVISRLHDTPRTTERWMTGEPVGELQLPFRPTVMRALGLNADLNSADQVDRLTGWLTLAVAFQSLSASLRDALRRDFAVRDQQPWSLQECVRNIQRMSFDAGERPVRVRAVLLLRHVEQSFASRPRDVGAICDGLDKLQCLISQEPIFWQRSYQYIHDWFRGRLAAVQGRQNDALRFYDAAVEGMWWRGGPNQAAILNEALLFAVGVGDLVVAKRYWDRTFMLGLNRWPKRTLDEQERRRLAFACEKTFAPQLAKDRVPPAVEILLREGPFALTSQQLKNPNSKVKHAEGRTRRTPLMDAVREGTLQDVERAIEAGGDPDDFIKESGEGPLSYAMRRACNRRDPLIMNYLLGKELLPETVNRQASTGRETPLKIAIEMADAVAVERLVRLGADVEHACDCVPSALVYAMLLLHSSIHRHDKTQERAFLGGRTRADVHDAKDGAVLDIALASRRLALAHLREASPHHRELFDQVMDWFIRPPEVCREVVKTLLRLGADPNRRYKVEHEHLAEWTPTLFGAELGDRETFVALLRHGGNPDLVLMQSSAMDRQDAMWVAVSHGRHSIVDYLVKRVSQTRVS
jgi:hypothetical protein